MARTEPWKDIIYLRQHTVSSVLLGIMCLGHRADQCVHSHVCCYRAWFVGFVRGLVLFVSFSAVIMLWYLLNITNLGHGIKARTHAHGRSMKSPTRWRRRDPSRGQSRLRLPCWRFLGSLTYHYKTRSHTKQLWTFLRVISSLFLRTASFS